MLQENNTPRFISEMRAKSLSSLVTSYWIVTIFPPLEYCLFAICVWLSEVTFGSNADGC